MHTVKHDTDSDQVGTTERHVGDTVRLLRTRSGLSLRTLAARVGFSPSFISQVEHGTASPSIASLERIASALGVTLGEFFASEPRVPGEAVFVRASERSRLASDWSDAIIEALGPRFGTDGVEFLMVTLAAGGRSGVGPAAHHGEEFAVVFDGELHLSLASSEFRLQRGDAVSFSSETPHQWENRSRGPASVLIASRNASAGRA